MAEQPEHRQRKPLSKLQNFLVEAKKCIRLLRGVLIEIKELMVVITMIVFFALGVCEAVIRLIVQPSRTEGQTVSRPYAQDRK